jgi:hypothetical protein
MIPGPRQEVSPTSSQLFKPSRYKTKRTCTYRLQGTILVAFKAGNRAAFKKNSYVDRNCFKLHVQGLKLPNVVPYVSRSGLNESKSRTQRTLKPGWTTSVLGFSAFALPLCGREDLCLAFDDFCGT